MPRKGDTRVDKAGVAEEYSSMAPNYNVGSLATRREGQERIRRLVRRGDVVLDVGCGPGFALPMEARYAGKGGRVLAIDISLKMLLEARQCFSNWHYPERKFDNSQSRMRGLTRSRKYTAPAYFILCDAERLPIKTGVVDSAFSFTSIHRMNPSTVLDEMWRILSPGGYLLFDVPGSHDEDAMVFQHVPPAYLPGELPRGFPSDFKLDREHWEGEQRSWILFKEFCKSRLPWLADKISHGWFNGYEALREKYDQFRTGKINEEELEGFIEEWERDNDSRKLGWICFPTRRAFASLLEEQEVKGAVVVESVTSSFRPNLRKLMRTSERFFELYVYIYSQVIRSHTAILWKPPWA